MDPLSITLSAISLATTLSSMLELALGIQDCFQQISRNTENARKFASDLILTLQQLKRFYDEHLDILENSPAIGAAVDSLMSEVQAIHIRCRAMVPVTTSSTVVNNAKITFKLWRNRTNIEKDIKELKHRVNLCYVQFTMFTSARVEVSAQRISDIATKIDDKTTRIEDRMFILENLRSVEAKMERNCPTSISDMACISQINSAPTLYTAVDLLAQKKQLATGYLCSEVEELDHILRGLPSSQVIYADTQGPYLRAFMPVVHRKPQANGTSYHHRELISKAININHILQDIHSSGVSFQSAAWNLVNLSIGLYHLELYPEAAIIGIWAVNLFRILVDKDPSSFRPYLVLSLHNLSQYHVAKKDDKETRAALSECLDITRVLVRESTTPEIIAFLSRSLIESSKIAAIDQDYVRSLQESQEAVKAWEDFFLSYTGRCPDLVSNLSASQITGVHHYLVRRAGGAIDLTDPNALASSADETMTLQWVYEYSRALHQYSSNLHQHGRFLEAFTTDEKALQLMRFSTRKKQIPPDVEFAEVLFHLSHSDFRLFIDIKDSLHYIQEAVEIYRLFSAEGSIVYRRRLYHSLYIQATIFRSMEDYTEEFKAWNQAIEVAKSIDENMLRANALYQICQSLRHLDRLDEAINMRTHSITIYRSVVDTPSPIVANAYYDLAVDLLLANRHKESKFAAGEAIGLYRIFAMDNYKAYAHSLADSVTFFASTLLCAYEVNEALDAGEEALSLYRSLIPQNHLENNIISKYMHCLDINMAVSFQLVDERKAIQQGRFIMELVEELLHLCPNHEARELIDFWLDFGILLFRCDQLQEARQWVEKAVSWSESHDIVASQEVERFMASLHIHALILDNQGFTEEALKSIVKAVLLGKKVSQCDSSLVSTYVASMVCQVDLLWELGRYRDALSASEETITFARRHCLGGGNDLIDSLLIHAKILNCNSQPERSIDIANEVVKLCQSNTSAPAQESSAVQLSQTFLTMSENLADLGRHDEALRYAQRSLNQLVQLQSMVSSTHWSHLRYRHTMSSVNLAEHLAADENYEAAIQLLSDARTVFEEFSLARNGYYVELYRILRLIALLHCSFDHHEEGAVVAGSLATLRGRLSILFPGVASLVDEEFERPTRRPFWLIKLGMTDTSNCPRCGFAFKVK